MVKLKGIVVEDFAHPEEETTLRVLKKTPMLGKALNWFSSEETRIVLKSEILGKYFRITEKDMPKLYKIVREVCEVLDYKTIPQLYMFRSMEMSTFIYIADTPVLIFPDFIIGDFDEDMLRFEIGCAITSLKAQTIQLKLLAGSVLSIPVVGESLKPVLANWARKAKLTADRGGLLACQDIDAALKALMRIAGIPRKDINTACIHEYLKAYNKSDKLVDMAQYAQTVFRMTPWNNERIVELYNWYVSGAYDDILEDFE